MIIMGLTFLMLVIFMMPNYLFLFFNFLFMMADLMIMIFMLMMTIIMMLYYSDISNNHIFDDDGLR